MDTELARPIIWWTCGDNAEKIQIGFADTFLQEAGSIEEAEDACILMNFVWQQCHYGTVDGKFRDRILAMCGESGFDGGDFQMFANMFADAGLLPHGFSCYQTIH